MHLFHIGLVQKPFDPSWLPPPIPMDSIPAIPNEILGNSPEIHPFMAGVGAWANNSPAETMEPVERAWETLPASGDFRASGHGAVWSSQHAGDFIAHVSLICEWSVTYLKLICNWSKTDLQLIYQWFITDLYAIADWSINDLKLI